METMMLKRSCFHPARKVLITDMISYLFVALFIYTASSKSFVFKTFIVVLNHMPWIGRYGKIIAYGLPIIEVLVSLLLIIPATRKKGLYTSLLLMITFTVYLICMVLSGSNLPCNCGGVISRMSWPQHIWFNLIFIGLAFTGLNLSKTTSN